jgi:hypothetical protein
MKRVLSWLVRCWAYRAVTKEFCSALAALAGLVRNIIIFSSPYTFSIPLFPSSSNSNLGRQPCWDACLLMCVSLVSAEIRHHKHIPNLLCDAGISTVCLLCWIKNCVQDAEAVPGLPVRGAARAAPPPVPQHHRAHRPAPPRQHRSPH